MKKYLIKFRVCEREFSVPDIVVKVKECSTFQDAYDFAFKCLELMWGQNDSAEILCIRQEKGE